MQVYPSKWSPVPIPDLETWNTDRSPDVPVMVRGIMYKSGGTWYYWDGAVSQSDAANLRVSAIGQPCFNIPPFDNMDLGYGVDGISSIDYKMGAGSVGTLILTYDGGNLDTITLT